ncbi:MAG: hypothetical protein M1118_00550 [Chloroflexi bacterium]|nr:hypothetical protein [Chloroflexota bacterium]
MSMLVQAAIREYLARRGYGVTAEALQITPAGQGNGFHDVSTAHDRYFAEAVPPK